MVDDRIIAAGGTATGILATVLGFVINLEIGTIALFVTIITSIYNSYYNFLQIRVRGPQFHLIEAAVKVRELEAIKVEVLLHNTGDRAGHLRWKTIRIKTLDQKIFSPLEDEDELTWSSSPDEQFQKMYEFYMPGDVDLTGGVFLGEGSYSNHRGQRHSIKHETLLTGRDLKPLF